MGDSASSTTDTPSTQPRTHEVGSLEAALDSAVEGSAGVFLLIVGGDHAGRLFTIESRDYVIGRTSRADVRLDEPAVSQRHAKLVFDRGRHRLVDLGSTNGTHVNGQPLEGEFELRGGEVIRIGETELAYMIPQDGDADLPTMALERVSSGIARASRALAMPIARRMISDHEIEVRSVEGPSLQDQLKRLITFFHFSKRHWLPLTAFAFFGAALGIASVFALPPKGTARFEIRLKPRATENLIREQDPHSSNQNTIEFFQSAESNFKSLDLIRTTLGDLGEKDLTLNELQAAQDRLAFESVAHRTYRGTYTDSTPEKALEFLDRHVELYLQSEVDKTLKVVRAEVEFLKGQLDDNGRELSRVENQLRTFKQKHIDGLPEQARNHFSERLELTARQRELAADAERANLELRLVRQRLKSEDPIIEQKIASSRPYESASIEVNRQITEAKARGLGDEHPELVKLRTEKAELEKVRQDVIHAEATDVERRANPKYQLLRDRAAELRVAATAAEAELGRVSARLSAVDDVVQKLPEVEATFAELSRSYDSIQALHSKLFQQHKEGQLRLELERASAAARYEVTMPPTAVPQSMGRTVFKRVTLALFAGLMLGLLIALALELRRYVIDNGGLAAIARG